jgi:hypothetical protein
MAQRGRLPGSVLDRPTPEQITSVRRFISRLTAPHNGRKIPWRRLLDKEDYRSIEHFRDVLRSHTCMCTRCRPKVKSRPLTLAAIDQFYKSIRPPRDQVKDEWAEPPEMMSAVDAYQWLFGRLAECDWESQLWVNPPAPKIAMRWRSRFSPKP